MKKLNVKLNKKKITSLTDIKNSLFGKFLRETNLLECLQVLFHFAKSSWKLKSGLMKRRLKLCSI